MRDKSEIELCEQDGPKFSFSQPDRTNEASAKATKAFTVDSMDMRRQKATCKQNETRTFNCQKDTPAVITVFRNEKCASIPASVQGFLEDY